MTQTTSSGWAANVAKPHRFIQSGVLISWMRTTASGVKFFQINQSKIGGHDIIRGGGSAVTFYDKYDFGDYSAYALNWSITRKLGQFPYGTIMAQADVQLNNASKLFLPNFDATIGSGILPNRPIKISLGIEGESLKQFVGFTGMPENTLNNRITTLHAFDAFNFINGFVSTASGAQVNKYAHEIKNALLGEMGFGAAQSVLDTSLQQPIGYVATNGLRAGDIWQKLDEAEQAMSFVDENGIIRSWNRQHFTTLSGTLAFQLTYSKMSDLQWQNTPVINDVIVRAKPRSVQAKQKIWELDSAYEVPSGGNASNPLFISFTDSFGDLPVTSVDIPTYITTATTSTFTTNTARDDTGDTGSAYISLASAYSFGNTYKMIFNNTFTSSIFITSMSIYATPAKVTSVIEERYQDQTSIDVYGRNPANNGDPLLIENDFIQTKDGAKSLGYTLVKEYKDPRKRYLAPVANGSNPAWQIGDAGTLTIQDTGEVKSVYITGKIDKLKGLARYDQILEVEERSIKRYFTINQINNNGTDSIAP